ncbi:MAG TPA: protein-export chaperone SecB [Gammaproteobacteria bacterium]
MSETETSQPQFAIQRLYLKDLSFETPNTPHIFNTQGESAVNVELDSSATRLAESVYEVVLSLTVTSKLADKVAYLVEVKQAGIFTMSGFKEQDLNGMLHSFCPNILFPYVRESISSVVNKGSFPQLLLAPINFDAIYAQHLEKQKQLLASSDTAAVH